MMLPSNVTCIGVLSLAYQAIWPSYVDNDAAIKCNVYRGIGVLSLAYQAIWPSYVDNDAAIKCNVYRGTQPCLPGYLAIVCR